MKTAFPASLKSKLGDVGFTVDIAGSAADAGAALELISYDAAILDLGLPDGDGLTVLAATRQSGKNLPILILTARDAVEDRVAGLNAGADDYLTEPFAMAELIARIKALLLRPGGVLGMTLEAGNVRLDTIGRELTISGIPARLSRRELTILEQMMRRFGRIVPKAVLEEKLYVIDEEPDSNPVPVPMLAANDLIARRLVRPFRTALPLKNTYWMAIAALPNGSLFCVRYRLERRHADC